jgi:hypothetical protein
MRSSCGQAEGLTMVARSKMETGRRRAAAARVAGAAAGRPAAGRRRRAGEPSIRVTMSVIILTGPPDARGQWKARVVITGTMGNTPMFAILRKRRASTACKRIPEARRGWRTEAARRDETGVLFLLTYRIFTVGSSCASFNISAVIVFCLCTHRRSSNIVMFTV